MTRAASSAARSGPTTRMQSKTDPDAKLYRKGHGQEAKLSYLGHVLMENRNGMIVDAMVTQADGTAEREAAMILMYRQYQRNRKRASLRADDAWCGQGVRHARFRRHLKGNERSTACSAECKPIRRQRH